MSSNIYPSHISNFICRQTYPSPVNSWKPDGHLLNINTKTILIKDFAETGQINELSTKTRQQSIEYYRKPPKDVTQQFWLLSVLQVGFFLFTCVLESEFSACFTFRCFVFRNTKQYPCSILPALKRKDASINQKRSFF